ncbi:MAG: SAM-dependent methyltransferase [Rhodocyclaceae bacterium]|nr:SAM-dependent methyltransferase [Rhodocyclaceae bacterium]
MQADFLDAHARHWEDAERLFQAQRWANADHLYGLSAECGLKRLMLAFGMPYDTNKNRPAHRNDRQHANGIWLRYETYRCGHHQGAGYALPSRNPFQNWEVSQRYAHQSHFDQARALEHRSGANAVRQLINKAQKEGLI